MASKPNKKSDSPSLNIQSYVRIRPLLSNEKRSGNFDFGKRDVSIRSCSEIGKAGKVFTFDRVFGEDSKQVSVYSTIVRPMIKEVIQGYNCTVFAYGQTGTGKTYTMSGNQGGVLGKSWEEDSCEAGIIPRAVEDIFLELGGQTCEYQVSVSFIELYNEKLRSLLSHVNDDTNIQLIDDMEGGVILKGLSPTPVNSSQEAFHMLQQGAEKRQVAATMMNVNSSRSHTIFTISVKVKESGLDKEDILRVGKLHLVDLAGSENVTKSGANEKYNRTSGGVNKRLAEASNINKSLLTLGRVISSIIENNPHIPYRESKLTRLLRDSLGGRTKTCVIGTISPSQGNIDETESTLNYAYKARSIKNKPEKNQTISKKEFMQVASEEILKLRRDLEAVRQGDGFYISKESHEEMTSHMTKLDVQVKEWYERYNSVNANFDQHKEMFSLLKDDFDDKCAEYEELEKRFQYECEKFKKSIEDIKKEIIIREYFINEYKKTEENLTQQAKLYKSVFENILEQNCSLHDKISKKEKTQMSNIATLEDYKRNVAQKLEDLEVQVTQLYEREDHVLSHTQTYTVNLFDSVDRHCRSIKNQLNDYTETTKKRTQELQALDTKMVEMFQDKVKGNSTVLEECVATNKRILSELTKELTERTLGLVEGFENTVSYSKEMHMNLKNETIGLQHEFKTFTSTLKETIEFILNKNNSVTSSLNRVNEMACDSEQASHEALLKFEEMANNINKMLANNRATLEKTFAKSQSMSGSIQQAVAEACSVRQEVEDKAELFNAVQTRVDKHLNHGFTFLSECHQTTAAKLGGDLQTLNNECSSMGDVAINHIDSVQVTLQREEIHCKELGTTLNDAVNVILKEKQKMAEESSKANEDLVNGVFSHTSEWSSTVESTMREEQKYVHDLSMRHGEHRALTSDEVKGMMNTVQHINYSVDSPRGTTPKRLNKKDLAYPRQLARTDPPEVMVERFYVEPIEQAIIEPYNWVDVLNKIENNQNLQTSITAVNIEFKNPNLRRSTSVPDLNSWTENENKENSSRPSLNTKKFISKSASRKPIKPLRNLCDLNVTPNI